VRAWLHHVFLWHAAIFSFCILEITVCAMLEDTISLVNPKEISDVFDAI